RFPFGSIGKDSSMSANARTGLVQRAATRFQAFRKLSSADERSSGNLSAALITCFAMDTPDEHVTFMRSQWADFAAFAWEKYLSEGRGAVVIDLRHASKDGPTVGVPSYYVAEASEGLRKRGGWPSREVEE